MDIAFDFDGTLVPFRFPNDPGEPFEWVIPLFRELHEKGYELWVYSARFNAEYYGEEFAEEQLKIVWNWLEEHGLTFVRLTAYKPPASIIFDDVGRKCVGEDVTLEELRRELLL
jgi:FMN phosphatase YigB (HAD superfamily)